MAEQQSLSDIAAGPATPATPPLGIVAERVPVLRRPGGGMLVRLAVLIIAGAVSILFATRWDFWVGSSTRQVTDDAYVRGDITPLSAKVEGYVRQVAVVDFQIVKKGDLVVEIDDEDYQARVAQAEADLLGAEAAIENLKSRKALQHAQITQAESVITATEADVERTKQEAARQRALLATSYGTPQRVEQAVADEKRLQATLARNRAEFDGQRREMAVLDTQEAQLRADAKAKRAQLDLAKINLGYTRILAPVDGMVGERGVRDGQYLRAGTQVLSVVPLLNVWVLANYKETQLTNVAIGQKAEITVEMKAPTMTAAAPTIGRLQRIAAAGAAWIGVAPAATSDTLAIDQRSARGCGVTGRSTRRRSQPSP